MFSKVSKVRIVQPPTGEAPFWVRQAWVGMELPIVRNAPPTLSLVFGVISGPKSFIGNILGLLCGKTKRMTGYPVYAVSAVDLLAISNPDAVIWWRENTPHLLRPSRVFLFNEDACSPLT